MSEQGKGKLLNQKYFPSLSLKLKYIRNKHDDCLEFLNPYLESLLDGNLHEPAKSLVYIILPVSMGHNQ